MHARGAPHIEDLIDRERARLLARTGEEAGAFEVYEDERYRWLQTRDGTLHSLMDRRAPARLLLPYTAAMMAGLLFVDAPGSVLMLGLGGASQARFLRRHFPDTLITAWERDTEVVEIARRDFGLAEEDDGIHIVTDDARSVIDFDGPPADLILLDLFGAGGMSPWIREAGIYKSCRRHLARDGVLVANFWIDEDDEFLDVLNGIQRAFEERATAISSCWPSRPCRVWTSHISTGARGSWENAPASTSEAYWPACASAITRTRTALCCEFVHSPVGAGYLAFAQESLRVTVRLNTGLPALLSTVSTQK
jgi:spermidine synthase